MNNKKKVILGTAAGIYVGIVAGCVQAKAEEVKPIEDTNDNIVDDSSDTNEIISSMKDDLKDTSQLDNSSSTDENVTDGNNSSIDESKDDFENTPNGFNSTEIKGNLENEENNGLAGWNTDISGNKYYIQDGSKLTGLQIIDGKKYYFNSNTGNLEYGKIDVNGTYYFFDRNTGESSQGFIENSYYNEDGTIYYGQKQIGGKWYFFDPNKNGEFSIGFTTISDLYEPSGVKTVYYDENGMMLYGLQKIGEDQYYFDYSTGALTKGQKLLKNHWYFFDGETGKMAKGFTYISAEYCSGGAKTVYYDENGMMLYGLQSIDGKEYYFNEGTGALEDKVLKLADNHLICISSQGGMYYGQKQINGNWYYFDEDNNGYAAVGFITIPEKYETSGAKKVYYDENGIMVYGQRMIDGKWYFFDGGTGKMATGFTYIPAEYCLGGAKTVYYDENGMMLYGLQKIGEDQYYFDYSTGALTKGQKLLKNHWYFFDGETGKMAKGFTYISAEYCSGGAKTVYYDENGMMLYGLQSIDGKEYYFNEGTGALEDKVLKLADNHLICISSQGGMYYGQKQINGNWYYFDEDNNGYAAVGFITIPEKYETSGAKKVYYDENGIMVYGQRMIDGKWYFFDGGTGKMATGFTYIPAEYCSGGAKTVYYDQNGVMQYGYLEMDGNTYYLDNGTGAVAFGPNVVPSYEGSNNFKVYYFDSITGAMLKETGVKSIDYYTFTLGSDYSIVSMNINGIPYYNQRDAQWACSMIGYASFASSGCVPSVMTMMINFYKGYITNPVAVARDLHNSGFTNTTEVGTSSNAWRYMANKYGFKFQNNVSYSQLELALKSGKLVGIAMGPGTFAMPGYTHEILLYGYDNGYVNVNDPYDRTKTRKFRLSDIWLQKSTDPWDTKDGGPIFIIG